MRRRALLKTTLYGAAAAAICRPAAALLLPAAPILDSHIHLFDPTRPGGIPWPEKTDTVLYKPALPERYKSVTDGLGVVGAIAIEASPLASDNDWLLGVAAANPIIVGVVGDLVPGEADYSSEVTRLQKNPLFLGMRYGNLWKRDLLADLEKPGFVDGLRLLSQAGLVFESANPDAGLLRAIVKVAERLPDLRIVVDHLPHATILVEASAAKEYWAMVTTLSHNPRVFVKLSEIPVRAKGKLVTDANSYKAGLDRLWDMFGEDRCLFGSDWPNSDTVASYGDTLGIVRRYIAEKGPRASHKYFFKNSVAVYKWRPRLASQSQSV